MKQNPSRPPRTVAAARRLRPLISRVPLLAAALAALMLMAGCSSTTTPRADTAGALTQQADAVMAGPTDLFAWAGDIYEAEGSAGAPRTIVTEPQRSMAGKLKAKRAAIGALGMRVGALPVTETQNLAAVMNANIGVKRAVERHLDTAEVVAERQPTDDQFEVRVRAALRPIAEILEKHHITPAEAFEPPATPAAGSPHTT